MEVVKHEKISKNVAFIIDKYIGLNPDHPEYIPLNVIEEIFKGTTEYEVALVSRLWKENRKHEAKGVYER